MNERHIHRLVPGPAADISLLKQKYEPVSCDFSDQIEDFSVRKLPVELRYWENSRLKLVEGKITDIFTTPEKEEFLKLEDGTLVRLDKIMEIKSMESAA